MSEAEYRTNDLGEKVFKYTESQSHRPRSNEKDFAVSRVFADLPQSELLEYRYHLLVDLARRVGSE